MKDEGKNKLKTNMTIRARRKTPRTISNEQKTRVHTAIMTPIPTTIRIVIAIAIQNRHNNTNNDSNNHKF